MPEGSSSTRNVACALVGLGVFLLVVAVLVPTYTLSQLRKTPLDLVITTIANSPEGGGEVLNIETLTSGDGPAVVDKNVPLVGQRYLTVEEPSDSSKVTLQVGVSVRRTDKQGQTGLIQAYVDKTTIDRKTGETLEEPVGSVATNAQGAADEVPHYGWQYRFPFGTEKKNYPIFDATARKAFDAEFIEETEVDGMKVYLFRQHVPPQNLYDVVKADSNSVTLPAKKWGVPGEGNINMKRFYANDRELYIEPKTGTLIKGTENIHSFFARSADKPELTALKAPLVVNQDTVESQREVAQDAIDKISFYGRVLPIILGLLGLLAVAAGLILGLKGGGGPGRTPAVAGPTPPSGRAGTPARGAGQRAEDVDPPTEVISPVTDRLDLGKHDGDDNPTQVIKP